MNTPRILLLAACASAAWSQVATQANQHYQTAAGREEIAQSLISPERNATEHPQELVDAMHLKPGMTVADIGTGPGYMLPYLSRAVGPTGNVVAEDIFADFLAAARKRATQFHLDNVSFDKGIETDPHLADRSLDVILALDSYHHYNYPAQMLAAFSQALRDRGRLIVVDYYKRPDAMPGGFAMRHIRLDKPGVVREIESHGFHEVSDHDHIPGKQYMVVFEKK